MAYINEGSNNSFSEGIGYNVKRANELMEKIAKAYKDLGIYTKEQWEGVVSVLQNNWIGEDEQDYEKKLADKLCKLYVEAQVLTQNSLKTIGGLAQAWIDFQSKNTIDGTAGEYKVSGKVEVPTIKPEEKIVSFKQITIGEGDNRGLKTTSSAANIKKGVDEFVKQIQAKTDGLFSEIQVNNAFFGEQTSTIKAYIEKVGSAVGEVTIAVRDMYNALDVLANSSYTGASSDIAQQFTTANSDVEASLNNLGGSRWGNSGGGSV